MGAEVFVQSSQNTVEVANSASEVAVSNEIITVTFDTNQVQIVTVGEQGPQGPAGAAGTGIVTYTAETDSDVAKGQAVYVKSTGNLGLAAAGLIAGLATEAKSATFATGYTAEGALDIADWTSALGTALLTPGSTYYLDPVTPGMLTATAPVTSGQHVVRVGKAMSTTLLDISIAPAILL